MPKKYPTVYHRIQAELQKEYNDLYAEITTNWAGKWVDTVAELRLLYEKDTHTADTVNRMRELVKMSNFYFNKAKAQPAKIDKCCTRMYEIGKEIQNLNHYCYYYIGNDISLPMFDFKEMGATK